jgi:hypothetical protein
MDLQQLGRPGQAIGLTTIYGPSRLVGLGLHRWYTHLIYLQQSMTRGPRVEGGRT